MKISKFIGKRYGKIVVTSVCGVYAICRCDCGNVSKVWKANLYRGNTKSCGCIAKRLGGLTAKYPAEHGIWRKMLSRCYDINNKSFKDYGARGIVVCDSWKEFKGFIADMGGRPSTDMTLDRINNNGDYEPCNCRWATRLTQGNNTRKNKLVTIGQKTQTQSQWLRETRINKSTFYYRVARGIPRDEAILMGRPVADAHVLAR